MKDFTYEEEKELIYLTPIVVKQYIIDLIYEDKSIGDICDGVNLPTIVVADVVVNNIDSYEYIRRRVRE